MFPIYQWLAYAPGAAAIEVFMVVLGAMFVGRHIFQGQPYQFSYSAFFGGMAIFLTYKFAGEILQQPGLVLNPVFQDPMFHVWCLVIGIWVGLYFQAVVSGRGWEWGKTEYMDLVYALFFCPLIVYLCLVSAAMIWFYGDWWAIALASDLYILYVLLVALDNNLGVLDQVPWGRAHPIRSRNDPR
ncbi:MAG: hypothetical protein Q7S95_00440 [bacterium]|nr:hypothetical protein [bacterium]